MHTINNADEGMTHTRPLIPDVPIDPGPTYRPPPKPIRLNMPRGQDQKISKSSPSVENINPVINLDFKENSPFQEDIILKLSKDQTNHFFKTQRN